MQLLSPPTATGVAVPTTCTYCSLQCPIHLHVDTERQEALAVTARQMPGAPGLLCGKGHVCHTELRHPERLRTPLVRRNGRLEPASWEEAMAVVAEGLKALRDRYGPDSLAVYSGGCLSNEKSYLIGKWARLGLGTRNIDYNGRYCMSAAAAAQNRAFGIDRGLPFPLADLAQADCIILAGTNLGEAQPPMTQYLTQARKAGARIIAIDPRQTPTTRLAHLHLAIRPGADLALMNGLLHIALRDGYTDEAYIAARTVGFEAVRATVERYTPSEVARITGIDEAQIETAAAWYGRAERAVILTARGAEQHSKGVDTVLAHINLALACGHVGQPSAGFGPITGQANGQGGREHGLKADQLPGYRSITNPAHRAEIAAVWGCDPEAIPGPGLSAFELLEASLRGDIRGMVVLGSNPAVSAPELNRVEQALRSLDLLVVIDLFLSETAALADVVLPGSSWAEETGTITNLEGRVLLRRQALTPPEGARADTAILLDLAGRLGAGRYFPDQSDRELFDEFRRATRGGIADYAGITYERLEQEGGLFWPCPAEEHPGTPRLFAERFAHPDGRARFHPVQHRPAAEEPDAEFPVYLTTGRISALYQSGNQTRRIPALVAKCPEPLAELHPELMARVGLAPGAMVRIVTRRGAAVFGIKANPGMRSDTVFVPFHWGGAQGINRLVGGALDPVARMPEFKVGAARLECV